MKNWGGQFTPKSGGHFKLELGGQYHWNLHKALSFFQIYGINFSTKAIRKIPVSK
jgi:hypothetical protein